MFEASGFSLGCQRSVSDFGNLGLREPDVSNRGQSLSDAEPP